MEEHRCDSSTIHKLGCYVRHAPADFLLSADPRLALISAVLISTDERSTLMQTLNDVLVAALRLPCTLNRLQGMTPSLFLFPDVPTDQRIWAFKSGGRCGKIHGGPITLSIVKFKLYIQSICLMMPSQHLIEIKCQNA